MKARALMFMAVFLAAPLAWGATGTIAPMPKALCLDANGAIVNGGKIFTYVAGTTTKLTSYSDSALTVANANPVLCDSSGRATIFLSAAAYKFTYSPANDTDPPTAAYFTVDNIAAVPYLTVDLDITGTAGEALTAGDAVYLSDGTGGCGATAGRWYKTDADLTCASTTAQAIGMIPTAIASAAAGSIRIAGRMTDLAGLSTGSVYYVSATAGAITSTAPANTRAVGAADSTTSLVISSSITTAAASATQAGVIALAAQTLGTGTKSVDKLTYKPGAVTTFDANASGRILGPFIVSRATSGVAETSTIATAPTIKANTLNADGDVLRATWVGITSADTQAKTWTLKLGGTTITTFTFTPDASAAHWKVVVEILRTAAAAQIITFDLIYMGDTPQPLARTSVTTGSKDLTTALTLDLTMTNAVAGTITFKGAWIEVLGL